MEWLLSLWRAKTETLLLYSSARSGNGAKRNFVPSGSRNSQWWCYVQSVQIIVCRSQSRPDSFAHAAWDRIILLTLQPSCTITSVIHWNLEFSTYNHYSSSTSSKSNRTTCPWSEVHPRTSLKWRCQSVTVAVSTPDWILPGRTNPNSDATMLFRQRVFTLRHTRSHAHIPNADRSVESDKSVAVDPCSALSIC